MKSRSWILLLASLLLLPAPLAMANCWNADKTFYHGCADGSSGAIGASAPLLGETMESNPASLPTQPTPFGIEALFSDRSAPKGERKLSFSTVKGFDGIGFGLGSWSSGTFSAPDLPQHFLGSSFSEEFNTFQSTSSGSPGIRIGTTALLPRGPFPPNIRFSLGASAGLGRVKGDWAPQLGALARISLLGIGYSESFERIAHYLPRIRVSIFASGLQLGQFYLGYSRSRVRSEAGSTFSSLYGLRFLPGKWTFHGGLKLQRDHRGSRDAWFRGGITRQLGRRFSAGYEYGIYRHSHSGALRAFF
jgi:hypothetical protein